MLFDLFLTTKVSIKIEYPNKTLLFIENLCFRSLKIAVCAPKITIMSKNCRLKITDISKNYGLKIPVRVRMRVCMRVCACVCMCVCMIEENRTHDRNTQPPEHKTPPEHHRKREEHQQSGKPVYMYDCRQ